MSGRRGLVEEVSLDDWQILPLRGRQRGWAVAFGVRDSHVTYRRGRRGPFRGLVQAVVEDSYRRRRGSR